MLVLKMESFGLGIVGVEGCALVSERGSRFGIILFWGCCCLGFVALGLWGLLLCLYYFITFSLVRL